MAWRVFRWAAIAGALLQVSCAGVSGIASNDTGGIIPWSPETERAAFDIAASRCAPYQKYARINSIHRHPGDYISFSCVWSPHARP
ncbi:MAG TPA: hypothetical protein VHN11_18175 [Xanthobacteraceae bacterium]|nr:hypothetical protein [Xanthobacteraceae bacterium]